MPIDVLCRLAYHQIITSAYKIATLAHRVEHPDVISGRSLVEAAIVLKILNRHFSSAGRATDL